MRNPLAKSYLFARFAFTNFTWQFFVPGFQWKGHAMEPGKILGSSLLVLLTMAEIESTTRLEPAPPAGKAVARMPLRPGGIEYGITSASVPERSPSLQFSSKIPDLKISPKG
jgi:hypothetical protein